MMHYRTLIAISMVLLLVPTALAAGVEFNYEGRVLVNQQPYSGDGYFKFAITTNNGLVSLWSNDCTSVAGSEPGAAVVVDVTDGIFNVVVGDDTLANMLPLDPSLFNAEDKVKLRVWFSNSAAGQFEHLRPDRHITNPALLGTQSSTNISLYVDPVGGNDSNSGLEPNRAKQTIQSAWDALPPLIRANATINLADGVYREEVLLSGKSVIGNATIAIVGNLINPAAVRVTGANAEADTTAVRRSGFHAISQKNLLIQGILFDYTAGDVYERGAGVYLEDDSKAQVSTCQFLNNVIGIYCRTNSALDVVDVVVSTPLTGLIPRGIVFAQGSRGTVSGCNVSEYERGINLGRLSQVEIWDTNLSNCLIACMVQDLSLLFFCNPTSTISNCNTGVFAMGLSKVNYAVQRVTYPGTTTEKVTEDGSIFWN